MTKKAYVIGSNTYKSLSPTIFNHWFQKYKIKAEYGYIEIKEENFEKEIKQILEKKDLCGLNITAPYKEKIIPHLSEIDEHSLSIGAVNCVTKTKSKIIGKNTDWLGFKNSIFWLENKKPYSLNIKKNTAIVIGYGGSAKATIYALKKIGYKIIKVFNRSFEKIENLKMISPYKLKDLIHYTKDADLIVNTIPKNIFYKNGKQEELIKYGCYKKGNYGYDLVYTIETGFLNLFASPDQISGIYMLIHQAAPCFQMWFNIKPEINNELINIVLKKLKELK